MRQTQFRRVFILSAELSTLGIQENFDRSGELVQDLRAIGMPFDRAVGVYKNTVETSYVCLPRNSKDLLALKRLALDKYNQECFLYQDTTGDTKLISKDGYTTIGRLKKVHKSVARGKAYYTVLNDEYYIAS